MKIIQCRSMNDYMEYQRDESEFLPVFVGDNYLFAGPRYQSENYESCFGCFLEVLKDNESNLLPMILEILAQPMDTEIDSITGSILDELYEQMDSRVIIMDRKNYAINYHYIFKHPVCSVCKKKSSEERFFEDINLNYRFNQNFRGKRLEEIREHRVDIFDYLINPHTGLGQYLIRDVDAKMMPMYFIRSMLAGKEFYSYGRTTDLAHSKYSAIFEMLERNSSMIPQLKGSIRGSFKELNKDGVPVIHPKEFTLNDIYDPQEFEQFDDNRNYNWQRVFELNNGASYFIPEQIVYFDSQLLSKEKRFIYETSNGCALGGSKEEAILYALFEMVERDSFLVNWYNRIAPVKLNIENIKNSNIHRLVSYIMSKGFDLNIMNITMETGIPAIWVSIVDNSYQGNIKCYNAAGAHINPEKALEGALVEVITSVFVYNKLAEQEEKQELINSLKNHPEKVINMEDHVYFYAGKENYQYIKDYFTNKEVIDLSEAFPDWYQKEEKAYTLEQILCKVKKYHQRIFLADQSSDTLQKLGLYCVKIMIPTLLTMTFGNRNVRINYERVMDGPIMAGTKSERIAYDQINRDPHPFP